MARLILQILCLQFFRFRKALTENRQRISNFAWRALSASKSDLFREERQKLPRVLYLNRPRGADISQP